MGDDDAASWPLEYAAAGRLLEDGHFEDAERAALDALRAAEAAFGEADERVEASLTRLLNVLTARNEFEYFDNAAEISRRAIPVRQRLLGRHEARLGRNHPDLVPELVLLASAFMDVGGHTQEAEAALVRAQMLAGQAGSEVARSWSATINRSLADLYIDTGRAAAAEPLLVPVATRPAADPVDTEREYARSRLITAYLAQGHLDDAIPLFERRAAEMPLLAWQEWHRLARELQSYDRLAEAEATYRRALAAADAERAHWLARCAAWAAAGTEAQAVRTLCGLASVLHARGRTDEADATYGEALARVEQLPTTWAPGDTDRQVEPPPLGQRAVGYVLERYARFLRAVGRKAEAASLQARYDVLAAEVMAQWDRYWATQTDRSRPKDDGLGPF
ncbi:MAG: hypothetical protein JOZ81_21360 [Chloroflexi bacterium]|nr:hypothetical protein [Chloroflexota bacterium]